MVQYQRAGEFDEVTIPEYILDLGLNKARAFDGQNYAVLHDHVEVHIGLSLHLRNNLD